MTDKLWWDREIRPLYLQAAEHASRKGEHGWAAIIYKQLQECQDVIDKHKEPKPDAEK
jgi:hypothetical protein